MNMNSKEDKYCKAYFDWAATAIPDAEILKEAMNITIQYIGNPSSSHFLGKKAHEILEKARQNCAKALQVKPETLFFTSGGTEANSIPLLSLLCRQIKGTIIISAIEHPSVREQALMLKKCGWNIIEIKPAQNGIINVSSIEKAITPDTALICLMAVNNETGAIQPIYKVADMIIQKSKETGKRRPKFHVDAVQAIGKIPFDVSYTGIDSASISAHKLSGPTGIGLLYLAQKIETFTKGGGQEQGIRSGTENIMGAWALSRCIEKYNITQNNTDRYNSYIEQLKITNYFIQEIKKINGASIIPYDRNEEDFSPWIVQIALKDIPGEVLVRILSQQGIAISTGSACSSKKHNRPVLEAMGVSKELAINGVRFSFGQTTSIQDIQLLLSTLQSIKR